MGIWVNTRKDESIRRLSQGEVLCITASGRDNRSIGQLPIVPICESGHRHRSRIFIYLFIYFIVEK